MSEIFLSYAHADRPRIKPLLDVFAQQGWSVWWDRTIPVGKTWDRTIQAALDNARCVVVLWSRDSIESDWVQNEAHDAKERGILVPVLLDPVKPPLAFRRIQAANLIGWNGQLPHTEIDQLTHAVSGYLPEESRRAQKPWKHKRIRRTALPMSGYRPDPSPWAVPQAMNALMTRSRPA